MHIRTKFVGPTRTTFIEYVCYMVNGYDASLRRHRSVQRNSSFCHFCLVLNSHLVSTQVSEGTDVDVEQKFVEMGDIELPDDDPVQCGSQFCVSLFVTNWLRNSAKMRGYPYYIWTVRIWTVKFPGDI